MNFDLASLIGTDNNPRSINIGHFVIPHSIFLVRYIFQDGSRFMNIEQGTLNDEFRTTLGDLWESDLRLPRDPSFARVRCTSTTQDGALKESGQNDNLEKVPVCPHADVNVHLCT
jgi:hypothetical protein